MNVTVLPSVESLPDSCFVKDPAAAAETDTVRLRLIPQNTGSPTEGAVVSHCGFEYIPTGIYSVKKSFHSEGLFIWEAQIIHGYLKKAGTPEPASLQKQYADN